MSIESFQMRDGDVSILMVEDDEVDIMNVQRAFKKHNITNALHIAHNGEEALAMLRGIDTSKLIPMPKVILLDINMPKMNGLEFLDEIRKDNQLRMLSVFMLTTSIDEQDRFKAFEKNVAGYIVKPVDTKVFMEAVRVLGLFWSLSEYPK